MPKNKLEKAIELSELKKDLEMFVAQMNALSGAMNYVRMKIQELEKPKEEGGEQ